MRCPVCEQDDSTEFFQWDDALVSQQQLMPSAVQARACARGQIRLRVCRGCGFIWNAAFDSGIVPYDSSYEASQMASPAFTAYVDQLVQRLTERHGLQGKAVLEIGCGDGKFLERLCRQTGGRGVGFDPSASSTGRPANVTIIPEEYSERFLEHQGDLVCSRHVLEHLEQPVDFVRQIARWTNARRPVIFFEVPNISWSLQRMAFWDLYYEHCAYFSAAACLKLLARCDLQLVRLEEGFSGQYLCVEAIHGAPHAAGAAHQAALAVVLAEVESFAARWPAALDRLRAFFEDQGKHGPVAVWGAGSKTVTLLNRLALSSEQVACVVDSNPRKQGHYLPGTGHRIIAPAELARESVRSVVIVNPQYQEEIHTTMDQMEIHAQVAVVPEELPHAAAGLAGFGGGHGASR